jgi:hypothetical protein
VLGEHAHQSATRELLGRQKIEDQYDAFAGDRELHEQVRVIRVERSGNINGDRGIARQGETEWQRSSFAQVAETAVMHEVVRVLRHTVLAQILRRGDRQQVTFAKAPRDER